MNTMSTDERLARIERLILMSAKSALTLKEAALMLDISDSRLRHLISENKLPYYKQGKKTYFKKSDVEAWMLQTRHGSLTEIESRATTYTAIRNME